MTKTLFVPPKVAKELMEERRQFAADLFKVTYVDDTCARWNRELRRLDDRLSMRRAYDTPVLGMPLEPGCYHLVRDNPDAPPSVTPVRGPDGGFCEPPGGLLEQLKSMDLWNVDVVRMRARTEALEQERIERTQEQLRDERVTETIERARAATRTQVSMNPDVAWTQNNSAAARRARGAKKAS
jgi:hypothetical protein